MAVPTIKNLQTEANLVNLWLSARPTTTKRVYLAEATALLAALPGGLREATAGDILTYVDTITGAPATGKNALPGRSGGGRWGSSALYWSPAQPAR